MTRDVGRLHVLTDATLQERFGHVDLARYAARGGADVVQFREKRPATTRALIVTATAMRAAIETTACSLIVDDRADVALACGVGVHLGRDDLAPAMARRILGPEAVIGGTANSLEEAVSVAGSGIDYLGVGPIYGTRTKANPAPDMGLETLAAIVEAVHVPVIAIGSIDAARIGEVMATGAYGVAVVSAVVTAVDPEAATAQCREALDAAVARSAS